MALCAGRIAFRNLLRQYPRTISSASRLLGQTCDNNVFRSHGIPASSLKINCTIPSYSLVNSFHASVRCYVDIKEPKDGVSKPQSENPPKLTLFQRFKQMYKDYWYV